MNLLEVGEIIAWREWRYRLKPVRLLSLSYRLVWPPDRPMHSNPDCSYYGIFGLKERPERWGWSHIQSAGPGDGHVLGQVALWGVVWEHERGYRAQYARPVKFVEARGHESDRAMERLNRMFF